MNGIGFVGADGTGKTTLIQRLKRECTESVEVVAGVARTVISFGYPLGKNASKESYIELSHRYQEKMFACLQQNRTFLAERTLLDPLAYAVVNNGLPRPQIGTEFIEFLRAQWKMDSRNFDVYFYFPIEFPVKMDDIRVPDEKYRHEVSDVMLELLSSSGIEVIQISGSEDARAKLALGVLSRYVD